MPSPDLAKLKAAMAKGSQLPWHRHAGGIYDANGAAVTLFEVGNFDKILTAVNNFKKLIAELERLAQDNRDKDAVIMSQEGQIERLRGEVAEITGKYALMAKAFPTVVEQGE